MKRILLKLSGEALAGDKHHGFDEPTVTVVAKQVKKLVDDGVQVGIVIGGGNFWRGRTSETLLQNYIPKIVQANILPMIWLYFSQEEPDILISLPILQPCYVL